MRMGKECDKCKIISEITACLYNELFMEHAPCGNGKCGHAKKDNPGKLLEFQSNSKAIINRSQADDLPKDAQPYSNIIMG